MEQIILNILEALRRGETVDDKALVKLIHAEARREGADKRDLAVFYASLPPGLTPSPEGESAPADQATIERGQQIYMEGDPAKGIPPCQGCHGADGGGHPLATTPDRNGYTPWAAYPSLRGQNGDYLQARLTSFRDAEPRNSSTDHVMSGVGARLDDDSIAALSAWLASQAH